MYLTKSTKEDLREGLENIVKMAELVKNAQRPSEMFDSAFQRCEAIEETARFVLSALNR